MRTFKLGVAEGVQLLITNWGTLNSAIDQGLATENAHTMEHLKASMKLEEEKEKDLD